LSWASDALFFVGGDTSYEIGGDDVNFGAANDLGAWVTIPDSPSGGTYAESFNATLNPVAGDLYLLFANGYASSVPMNYDRITITLKGVDQIPVPSVLALLGLAGLAGRRRRA